MRLLLVDDDENFLLATKLSLQNRGYDIIETAHNAMEAIEYVKSQKPDLILMDYHMPGELNGLEAAIRIYQDYNVPSVLISTDIPTIPTSNTEALNDFTYFRKSDDLDFLDFTIKQTKTAFDNKNMIQEQSNAFREIIDKAPYGILIIDKDGMITDANEEVQKIFKYSKSELLDLDIYNLISLRRTIDSPKPGMSWYLSLLKSKTMNQSFFAVKTKAGKVLSININASPIEFNNEIYIKIYISRFN